MAVIELMSRVSHRLRGLYKELLSVDEERREIMDAMGNNRLPFWGNLRLGECYERAREEGLPSVRSSTIAEFLEGADRSLRLHMVHVQGTLVLHEGKDYGRLRLHNCELTGNIFASHCTLRSLSMSNCNLVMHLARYDGVDLYPEHFSLRAEGVRAATVTISDIRARIAEEELDYGPSFEWLNGEISHSLNLSALEFALIDLAGTSLFGLPPFPARD